MPKATVVSVLPFKLHENKPGQVPGAYEIPAADKKTGVSVLVVEDAYFHEYIPMSDEKVPPRKVRIPADEVARGLIRDYQNANLGISYEPDPNGVIAIPGLFFLEGQWDALEVATSDKLKNLITQAKQSTELWFKRLVKMADDDWQKHRQHKMITDLQRSAAKHLGFKRDWADEAFEVVPSMQCPACTVPVNPNAMICHNCKFIINKELYAKNKENFAI